MYTPINCSHTKIHTHTSFVMETNQDDDEYDNNEDELVMSLKYGDVVMENMQNGVEVVVFDISARDHIFVFPSQGTCLCSQRVVCSVHSVLSLQ